MNFVYIAVGGSLGAIARYLISAYINLNVRQTLPLGTLFVNTTGSFLIGFLFIFLEKTSMPNEMKLLFITGFLGAYTTFSTYSLDTMRLALDGKYLTAAINFLVSNGLCFLLVVAGMKAAKLLVR